MAFPEDPTLQALSQALALMQAELQTSRAELERERAEARAARTEIRRLVAMVEGLTRQLDQLLGEEHAALRAELAEKRKAARLAAIGAGASSGAGDGDATPSDGPADTGADPDTTPPKARNKRKKRGGGGRKPLPAHLERNTVERSPEVCDRCGCDRLLARDVLISEEWDYVRAHLRVRRLVREVCQCAWCNATVTATPPPQPFNRASCTMALIAWLCFARCGLFMPLDRVRRDFRDQGAELPSSTLTRWATRGAELLMPIAESVRLSLLAGDHLQTDGTGLRVLSNPDDDVDSGPFDGQVLYFGDTEHAVYHFTLDKRGRQVTDFLTIGEDDDHQPIVWKGTITADAVSSHDCLFVDGDRIEAGCNAHGLRKFRDDADKAPLLARQAMAFIGRWYHAEEQARDKGLTGDALLRWRRARAGPVADEYRAWLDDHIEDLLPTHPVRKAMQYAINHWEALTRFLHDPDVPIDNNDSERALRKVALLRNNSMFASDPEGARRYCVLWTLIGTCRRIGVEPFAYLEWALTRVVPHPDNRGLRATDLTPHAYKARQQAEAD